MRVCVLVTASFLAFVHILSYVFENYFTLNLPLDYSKSYILVSKFMPIFLSFVTNNIISDNYYNSEYLLHDML